MKAETLSVISNIINFDEMVDAQGQPVKREAYKKEYIRGVIEINTLLRQSAEKGMLNDKGEIAEWIPLEEKRIGKIGATRYKNADIKLSGRAKEALEYYYKIREDIPRIDSEDVYTELMESIEF